uniref:Uncharacterized protein n=1 Tax=Timema monikensis TaxID=170555 RepID=A0A7R9EIL6_9NEOP|nr:unnamed protein product [Timema monikensis]
MTSSTTFGGKTNNSDQKKCHSNLSPSESAADWLRMKGFMNTGPKSAPRTEKWRARMKEDPENCNENLKGEKNKVRCQVEKVKYKE